jgi:hydrogenase nickel incorporation protein HypA/HybF
MHELAICQALLDEVERIARERGAAGIATVRVRIGELAGVEPQLLQGAYEIATAGTLAAGAALVIEGAPVRVFCPRCQAESPARAQRLVCGICGDWRTRVVAGDELLLMSVELIAPDRVRAGGVGEPCVRTAAVP